MKSRPTAAVATITQHGWLAACPEPFQQWTLANLQWRRFEGGTGITSAGTRDGGLYCIGEGQAGYVSGIGSADIGTSYFGLPGCWFGHAGLMTGEYIGSVIALGDCVCGLIPRSVMRARLAAHPEEWELMALGISDLFLLSAGAHADLLIPDSRRRMVATILRLGGWRHRMYRIAAPDSFICTQEQLAGAVAMSRNTAGKILRELEAERLIDTRYGRIAILDPKRLRAIANEG
jgi:CRP-like cAMP-binding protein